MADIGVKVGIEGAAEFKRSLAEINSEYKMLQSEMKLLSAQFAGNENSVDALTAKNANLNRAIENQKQKVDALAEAVRKSAETHGANSKTTADWTAKLIDAKTSLANMENEAKENTEQLEKLKKGIKDTGDAAEDSKGKFDGLGGVLKGFGAAMGTVVASAAGAAAALGKEVVSAYADFEQLVGGVDTLFGEEASKKLQEYAAGAFQTAGVSANAYMENVTGFAATLIQSLEGDTEEAVKVADMIMTDMSDNANKMGTDLASIQNAYQGFAKGNYTMLDNLKLGYGGTASEMARLVNDSGVLNDMFGKMNDYTVEERTALSELGFQFDALSGNIQINANDTQNLGKALQEVGFDKISEAIHRVQDDLGISEATLAESTETISGAVGAMQAAFQNLLAGLGNAGADITELMGHLTEAFSNVVRNVTPVLENLVTALPVAVDALLTAVRDLLPKMLATLGQLFEQVLTSIMELLPDLIPVAVDLVMMLVNTVVDNLPLLIDAAVQLVQALMEGISQALPELIPAAIEAILTITQSLIDNLPMLYEAGFTLLLELGKGLLKALPEIIRAVPEIVRGLITAMMSNVEMFMETGFELITALVDLLPEIIDAIVEVVPIIINDLVSMFLEKAPALYETGKELFLSLIKRLPEVLSEITRGCVLLIDGIVGSIKDAIPKIIQVGKDMVSGIWEGIQSAWTWLTDKVGGVVDSLVGGIKDLLDIHSPSRVFAGIGENMGLGMGVGFVDAMRGVERDMQRAIPTDFDVGATVNGVLSGASPVWNGRVLDVTIPLSINGTVLSRVLAQVQWSQNTAYIRSLGAT